jgi:hypothetical protein
LEEDPASRPENDDEQVRHLTPLDLEPFITPLVNATRILSALSPCALQGAAGAAAYQWIAGYAHHRAHELDSVINGRSPRYDTMMETSERSAVINRILKVERS